MFSRTSKYAEAGDSDEDDDSVDGIAVPEQQPQQHRQSSGSGTQPAPARVSSFGTRTLDHFFARQDQPQRQPAVGERAPQQRHQVRVTGNSAPVNHRKRRTREPSIDNGHDLIFISSDDGENVVARQPQSRPVSSASSVSRRPDTANRGRSTAASAKPFSKTDFLKKFESDASSEEEEEEEDQEDQEEEDYSGESEEEEDDAFNDAYVDNEIEMGEDGVITPDPLHDITSSNRLSSTKNGQASEEDDDEELGDFDILAESDEDNSGIATPTGVSKGGLPPSENTPKRSMTNSQLVADENQRKMRLQLEKEENETRDRIVKKASAKTTIPDATRNFDIIVITPDYLINPDEWEAVAIDSRWTSDDGQAAYKIIYKDGHSHTVNADHILEHVSPKILEAFEHSLFAKEENPETYYYPNFKAPGGCFAGGTAITSGLAKKRGRRSDAKIYLDNCFRLGMPEEFNIPMTDSSELDSDEESEAAPPSQPPTSSQLSGSQYDKFDITDAEILASIRENSSDNESWSGRNNKKPTRGRPRGRGATSARGGNVARGNASARGTGAPRGRGGGASRGPGRPPAIPSTRGSTTPSRGRPPLIPTRGTSTPQRGRPPLIPTRGSSTPRGSNVVKASVTSRGRGRPRGSKLASMRDTSSQESASPRISITAPDKQPGIRGRPKGSKNHQKLAPIPSSRSDTSLSDMSIAPASPQQAPRRPNPQPASSTLPLPPKKRILKPTRTPKPPRVPSGARGPGRPPKSPKSPKKEDDLIEETIRTAGANITSGNLLAPPSARTEPERPKKRRRIRFGLDGPEEHVLPSQPSPPRHSSSSTTPHHHHHHNNHHTHNKHHENSSSSSKHTHHDKKKSTNKTYPSTLDVHEVLNKMFLDGAPAYEVRLRGPHKQAIWVRLEDLSSKDARSKVKEFDKKLQDREQRETEFKQLLAHSISAELQLEKDKRRVAEQEARVLGGGRPVCAVKHASVDLDQQRRDKEKEERRQRERAARRLAMQETLFAGT
ncbi:hypothetical protein Dda_5640 [Drechslerella dactyloides]|uniref:Uncharacterized protein n=1 Tax=Drechslerella dactyloides TaxID=74499 RepID=A0AAD6IYP8_DREDA|nr:hypothetical protein Dda_5640 [Drechslerella dactyloides]